MQVFVIRIIGIFLISYSINISIDFYKKSKTYKRNFQSFWTEDSKNLYTATQIGIKRKTKNLNTILSKYGLLHLMTPSGIHLSSVLVFLKLIFPKKIFPFLLIALSLFLLNISGFHSLKRVSYFYSINYLLKHTKVSFIATFFFDIITGGFTSSPLSFSLSFIFWGTIIFSNSTKIVIIIELFITQLIVSNILSSKISFLTILINPIVTSTFSAIFPLLSFQYWVNKFDTLDYLSYKFHSLFVDLIYLMDNLNFSVFIPTSLILIFIVKGKVKNKIVFYLLLQSPLLNNKIEKVKKQNIFINAKNCRLLYSGDIFYDRCKKSLTMIRSGQ